MIIYAINAALFWYKFDAFYVAYSMFSTCKKSSKNAPQLRVTAAYIEGRDQ